MSGTHSRTVQPLDADQLYTACDLDEMAFSTTVEIDPVPVGLGQDRAQQALKLSLGMKARGYNLFALAPQGVGTYATVRQAVEAAAVHWPQAPDWCYINNFTEPQRPKSLQLPAGRARPLQQDMDRLVKELQSAIPAAFESDEYRSRKNAIQEQFKERQEEAFSAIQAEGKTHNIALIKTPMGLALAPIKDDEVLGPKEYEKLSDDEKADRKAASERLQKRLEAVLSEIPRWEKEQRDQLQSLNRDTTQFAVGHLIDDVRSGWADLPDVEAYLEDVRKDVTDNVDDFLPSEQGAQALFVPAARASQAALQNPLRRYHVNVLVDRHERSKTDCPAAGAPVVYEDHPTLPNLVGRVEHIAQFGTLVTDFNLIKAGALHCANGGCLILDARRVLSNPAAYDTLKRMIRSARIRIESAAESLGWTSTTTLDPEPIPLDVKVVLIGEPRLYYLLNMYDPDFAELFRVAADFDTRIDRLHGGTEMHTRMIASIAQAAELNPLDRSGVARVIEHSARLAGDSEKLTTQTDVIEELLRESGFWADEAGRDTISAEHVERAIEQRTYRSDMIRARIQEEIHRGTLVIETEGARVGQVNGLAVLQLNHFSFGKPGRISCRVRLGKGEVIDIEREVALGGPLHSKGVLILSSFVSTRYARERPLSLSASLVFEQSYGGVEGDSASSAELYALLSAISEIPIRQSLAVTGSVDQLGRVQAIGGVNEKIEGFFDVCRARGLSGEHGVLIPAANIKHLMLRRDVVDACRQGQFHVYAVETIDQGIEILTGVPAGAPDGDGTFPIGTVNRAVTNSLSKLAAKALKLAAEAKAEQRRTTKREDQP
ncbi:MAG: AAA family ATPase [Hyphomicrobiales bacterium]|nr:AAA family ATPase [Hyphomicrobiales bacterium]